MPKFVNAALAADWACYSAAADQADCGRLSVVIATFPRGFNVWFCNVSPSDWLPVAYTGWYPIGAAAFEKAYAKPSLLYHRGELKPEPNLAAGGSFVWLFNYSIIAQLRKSEQSRAMLQRYAHDLSGEKILGRAAAVLSEESKRVVERFGMSYRGDMTHDGVNENVYAMMAET
ncbi:MAG TPA: hypothetical protein VH107_11210 [Lacipirellulaceae bacterium]|nr:hypothetical protein [Lacipirellulaceae bacterium]